MTSRLFFLWILWIITLSAGSTLPSLYTIHHDQVNFDQAMKSCSPGVLASLATRQDVSTVQELIFNSTLSHSEFTFWIGLKKAKNKCAIPTKPLRGFTWVEDGSEDSWLTLWAKEPESTCTLLRCAALTGVKVKVGITGWALTPVRCKNKHRFICKMEGETPEAGGSIGNPASPKLPEPATPKPSTPEERRSIANSDLQKPPTPKPESAASNPTATHRPHQTATISIPPFPGPGPAPGSCLLPSIPEARSLSVDPNDSSRIQVACWSSDQLELWCRGHPTTWRLPDHSVANFTAICQRCEVGFRKNLSGTCEDVDECLEAAACRHTCLNTVGSFRCVCSNESNEHHNMTSPPCANTVTVKDSSSLLWRILIPVLVAVAVLLVLVAVVAVTVKSYLMRKAKKRDIKMAERMALKDDNKDSYTTANEKTV